MVLRRFYAALSAPLILLVAAGADAQATSVFLVGPDDVSPSPAPALPNLPDFRAPMGDLRMPGAVRRNGLIAAYPLRENLQIGIGRFAVPAIARPRTYMEADRTPTAARAHDRGIAAVGFSLRF